MSPVPAPPAAGLPPAARLVLAQLRSLAVEQTRRDSEVTVSLPRVVGRIADRAGLTSAEAEQAWRALIAAGAVVLDDVRGHNPSSARHYVLPDSTTPSTTAQPSSASGRPSRPSSPSPSRPTPRPHKPPPIPCTPTAADATETPMPTREPSLRFVCADCRSTPIAWRTARRSGRCPRCRQLVGHRHKPVQFPVRSAPSGLSLQ